MKTVYFLIVLFLTSPLFAKNYNLNDFAEKDLTNKIILYRTTGNFNIGYSNPKIQDTTEILGKLVSENSGSILDVDEDTLGWILTIDSIENVIKLLNQNEHLYPILEGGLAGTDNIMIYANGSSHDDIYARLILLLKTDQFRILWMGNVGIMSVDDMGQFKNAIFLSDYLNKGSILFDSKPSFNNVKYFDITSKIYGYGNLGCKKSVVYKIVVPEDYHLNVKEIPHFTHENILDDSSASLEEKYTSFDDVIIKEKVERKQRIYEIMYPFTVYQTGRFDLIPPTFYVSNALDRKTIMAHMNYFTVSALLSADIEDIQWFAAYSGLHDVIIDIPFFYLLIFLFIVFAGFVAILAIFSMFKKVLVEEIKISEYDIILNRGFTVDNWRAQYQALLQVVHNKKYPSKLIDELEKVYSDKAMPDFDLLNDELYPVVKGLYVR